MTIVYLVPSSGGAFYCGNCLRDSSFLKTIKNTGQDLLVVPMYLPLMNGNSKTINQSPVFFGAVSLYLKNSYKWMRKMPKWIENLLNSDFLLNYAAKKAGSTRATGLEDMTISMLKGEHGNQVTELNELVN